MPAACCALVLVGGGGILEVWEIRGSKYYSRTNIKFLLYRFISINFINSLKAKTIFVRITYRDDKIC